MQFPRPLVRGQLLRRYKRFLADVILDEDGREVTVHCPNPGAMLGLAEPGMTVWLEPAPPGRKMAYGWRLVEVEGGFAGIDTGVPNRVVGEALRAGAVPALAQYRDVRPEVRYGTENSRVDFLLGGEGLPDVYLEVKNVHLRRDGDWAEFPDCVTTRGAKHLRELGAMVDAGHCAVMFYLVQRTDCVRVRLAEDLDPGYAAAFRVAAAAGVEVVAHRVDITPEGVWMGAEIPFAPPV